ncbi:hypothetical protein [Haloprofundus salilacus]|uniref:hypothetical protein n=1 Tax=Haloprofundus salilacus TaxID=2876190 RepID=UPI001CCA47A6|nr:hypothetical protein [Haloprofundus salilacus]
MKSALLVVGLAVVVVLSTAVAFVGLPLGQAATDDAASSANNDTVDETGTTSDAETDSSETNTESSSDTSADDADDTDDREDDSDDSDDSDSDESSNTNKQSNSNDDESSNTGDTPAGDSDDSDDGEHSDSEDTDERESIESVTLTSENPQEVTVTNPNSFAVRLTLELDGEERVYVPAGETHTVLIADEHFDGESLDLYAKTRLADGDRTAIPLNNVTGEEPRDVDVPVERKGTSVESVELSSDRPNQFSVTNPNEFDVTFKYVVNGDTRDVNVSADDTTVVELSERDYEENASATSIAAETRRTDDMAVVPLNDYLASTPEATDMLVYRDEMPTESYDAVEFWSDAPEQVTIYNPNDATVNVTYFETARTVEVGPNETKTIDIEHRHFDDGNAEERGLYEASAADVYTGVEVPADANDVTIYRDHVTVDTDTPGQFTVNNPTDSAVDFSAYYILDGEGRDHGDVHGGNFTLAPGESHTVDFTEQLGNESQSFKAYAYRDGHSDEDNQIAVNGDLHGYDSFYVEGDNSNDSDNSEETPENTLIAESNECGQITVTNYYGENVMVEIQWADTHEFSLAPGETKTYTVPNPDGRENMSLAVAGVYPADSEDMYRYTNNQHGPADITVGFCTDDNNDSRESIYASSEEAGNVTLKNPTAKVIEVEFDSLDESVGEVGTVELEPFERKTVAVPETDHEEDIFLGATAVETGMVLDVNGEPGDTHVPVVTDEYETVEFESNAPEQFTVYNPNNETVEVSYFGELGLTGVGPVKVGPDETKTVDIEHHHFDDGNANERVLWKTAAYSTDTGAKVPTNGDDVTVYRDHVTVDTDTPGQFTVDNPTDGEIDFSAYYVRDGVGNGYGSVDGGEFTLAPGESRTVDFSEQLGTGPQSFKAYAYRTGDTDQLNPLEVNNDLDGYSSFYVDGADDSDSDETTTTTTPTNETTTTTTDSNSFSIVA